MGFLIDWGGPLRDQAAGCLVYIFIASALAMRMPGRSET